MTRFYVDDRLHSHPKSLAASLAAIGLWTVAGSWSGDHLTDGFVSDQAVSLLSRGSIELADELVEAGLWRRVRGGYKFHEWSADSDGSRRNLTAKEVKAERARKAEAGRKGGLASGKTRSKGSSTNEAAASRLLPEPPNPNTNTYKPPVVPHTQDQLTDFPSRFAEFWEIYPKRKGKGAAIKAWDKATKIADPQVILDAAKLVADQHVGSRDLTYVKHPASWLNQRCWEDEPDHQTPSDDEELPLMWRGIQR